MASIIKITSDTVTKIFEEEIQWIDCRQEYKIQITADYNNPNGRND